MNQTNWTTMLIALLGALKLVLQPFGIEITDAHVNDIVNGVSAAATIFGVIYHHIKQPKQPQHPFDGQTAYKPIQSEYGDHGPAV